MAINTSLWVCWILLSVCVPGSVCKDVNVTVGDDTILPCQAPNNNPILLVEWTRPDLESEYVFMYRDNQSDPDNQHPSFKNRVDLMDSGLKNRNLSVRLKNVTAGDSGTYECHVFQRGTNRRKRATYDTEPISIINLNVGGQTAGDTTAGGGKTPGHTDSEIYMRGHTGVILTVTGLIVLVVLVGLVIFKNSKGHLKNNSDLSVDEADVHQQLQENENSESKTITHYTSDIQV